MTRRRIVMAISYKGLGANLLEQKMVVARAARAITDSIQEERQVAIVHGNVPQVGVIHTTMSEFGKRHDGYNRASMSICSAMSQDYAGYDLQDGIRIKLIKCGIYKPASTALTQVTVDPYDEAFYTPMKVIGRVMIIKETEGEEAKGDHIKEVEGGFRRIVVSPHPIAVVEIDAIKALLDADQLVIVCRGDDIPVTEQGYNLRGISAIIEGDLTTGPLVRKVGTGVMMILVSAENVVLSYETKDKQPINRMTTDQARGYISQEQSEFASMLPKIAASMDFPENGEGREIIITTLDKTKESLKRNGGTVIEQSRRIGSVDIKKLLTVETLASGFLRS